MFVSFLFIYCCFRVNIISPICAFFLTHQFKLWSSRFSPVPVVVLLFLSSSNCGPPSSLPSWLWSFLFSLFLLLHHLRPSPSPCRRPLPLPAAPCGVLAVGLGGNTGAVSYQQSHRAGAGHGDRHAGGAHRARAGGVGPGFALVGVGAHVTLELRGRLTLDPAQLTEQHAAGARPAKAAPRPPALLPLLAVVLLGVDAQIGEGGETWKHKHRQAFRVGQLKPRVPEHRRRLPKGRMFERYELFSISDDNVKRHDVKQIKFLSRLNFPSIIS